MKRYVCIPLVYHWPLSVAAAGYVVRLLINRVVILCEQRYEYAQVVDAIREHVSEFRATLKSSDTRVPKAFPIKKIGISRIHAPNGVSTIRIEFVCPPFIDQEAILGRFLLNLQKNSSSSTGGDSRQAVEVFPVPPEQMEQKSIVEAYEQPSVTYLYANGRGSFQFVRDKSMQANRGSTFVFYKDEYLTQSEVDAVVGAYKEIYSYPHVHAFFRHDMSQSRRKMLAGSGGQKSSSVNSSAGSKVSTCVIESLYIGGAHRSTKCCLDL